MNLKSNKAITLVALIITIIILLILAGVSLSMILGENGLINKAQSSVNAYQQAALNEQNLLQSIEDYMGNFGLPENTPTTPAGTHVKPPVKWLGTIVDAVADGKGNTFPVPKSFYYVGGDYTNGVIISDDPADAYDGTTDKTTWEYTTNLVGNQFVWIPCTEQEYHKTDWGSQYAPCDYDNSNPSGSEVLQIQKYDGFYVGRYEAGLADTIKKFTTGEQLGDNFSSPGYNVEGIPTSKANQLPWNFINYNYCKKNAEKMYGNSMYVTSGLITGTQWDVMLNKFIGTTNQNGLTFTKADITDSQKWGNYSNNSITYKGRLARAHNNGSNWYFYPFGTEGISKTSNYIENANGAIYKGSGDGDLLTTGASKQTEAYHTYDVAGNMWEYTEEVGQTTAIHIARGGACIFSNIPACFRSFNDVGNGSVMNFHIGFRVALFIK